MISINWKRLLDQKGVEYIERGSSVVKGNIAVHCPFCGNADGGHHMGINLTNSYWGCWRNRQHRGKSPVRLLMALLKINYESARDIAGLDDSFVDPDGYEAMKHNMFQSHDNDAVEKENKTLEFPKEFEAITHGRIRHSRFMNYLERRGFPRSHAEEVCRVFKFKAAVTGTFKDRVIMPYYMDGKLVTWTGRAIAETQMRYMDLSIEESIIPPKNTFYNFNATRRPNKVLLVAEGPFDAVTCDFYSAEYGVRCVALSTNSMTDDQTYMLEEVAPNFEQVLIVMDNASSLGIVDSFRMKERLSTIKNIGYTGLPRGYKDFGEMPENAIVKFCKEIVNGL